MARRKIKSPIAKMKTLAVKKSIFGSKEQKSPFQVILTLFARVEKRNSIPCSIKADNEVPRR